MVEGGFLPGVKSGDYLVVSALPAFEQTRNASAVGRNLAGLETGTVSRKLSKISIKLSLTIGNHEGLHNLLGLKRILPGGHGSERTGPC
jgi:hypothetical protein